MAFAGHVLRGYSGKHLLDVLEGKLNSKLPQRRPRRMWLDDIKSWTGLDSYEKIKNLANDRKSWWACSITCQPSDTEEETLSHLESPATSNEMCKLYERHDIWTAPAAIEHYNIGKKRQRGNLIEVYEILTSNALVLVCLPGIKFSWSLSEIVLETVPF